MRERQHTTIEVWTKITMFSLLLPSPAAFSPKNGEELKAAVNTWVSNSTEALITFRGAIGQWNVSAVSDMSNMFCGYSSDCCGSLCPQLQTFNDDISSWDVSSVVTMMGMFDSALSFNGNLTSWDTSSLSSIRYMFWNAKSFSGDGLSSWDTGALSNMDGAFYETPSFKGDLSTWTTSSVTEMQFAFYGASAFNCDLRAWKISPGVLTERMFTRACNMDPNNLPKGLTSESTNLNLCGFCTNCPPEGGECLNGFKRSDSINCDICPEDQTSINNSCVSCPDSTYLSTLLSFLVLAALIVLLILLYFLRNASFMRRIEPAANLTNLIRAKQIGAAAQILSIFATLSVSLSDWFILVGYILSEISMPFEMKPLCMDWYEKFVRGGDYFGTAWLAFFFIYAVSFLLRHAHTFKNWNRERLFSIDTLVNFQKLAALLVIQAPIIILPMTFDPERMLANVTAFNTDALVLLSNVLEATYPSVLSYFFLAILFYLEIRRSSQKFKEIRDKLLEEDTISSEETIKDLIIQAPYYAAFCLQYTPQEVGRREERSGELRMLQLRS